MDRTQFTFYESFFKAITRIADKADRCDAYDAICGYALCGQEPDLDLLSAASAIAFELSKPNLDASRRKAINGKKGGTNKQTTSKGRAKSKQSESKPKAKPKQGKTASEKEKEKEVEVEKEKELENECYPPNPLFGGMFGQELQSAFESWLAYKAEKRDAYKPTGLQALQSEIKNNAQQYGEAAVAALIRECMGNNWKGIIFDRLKNPRGNAAKQEEPPGVNYAALTKYVKRREGG